MSTCTVITHITSRPRYVPRYVYGPAADESGSELYHGKDGSREGIVTQRIYKTNYRTMFRLSAKYLPAVPASTPQRHTARRMALE